ncbi:MAG: DUF4386 domain-containing protein [Calditrichia bacterium]
MKFFNIARVAGINYLFIFISGIFANFFVLESNIVLGDPVQTFHNFTSHSTLLRIGIFSFIVMVLADALLAWFLYVLLKPVDKDLSLLTGWLRLINATIFAVALLFLLQVLGLIQSEGAGSEVPLRIETSLRSFNDTWMIGLIFFGIHLLFLGYLIIKSGYFPKGIGWLLIMAGIGYLIDSFSFVLFKDYQQFKDIFMAIVIIPGVIGELSLTLWLLIKGNIIPPINPR